MTSGNDGRKAPWELVPGHQVQGRAIQLSLPERIRAARRVPQAVVKVASYCHGQARAGHLLSYISRDGALELETDAGEVISGKKEQRALLRDWAVTFDGRAKGRDVVHVVYSLPRGSNPEVLRRTMREVLKRSYPGHPAVFAIHEDRAHPHAHAAIHMRSRQRGKKLRLQKADLQRLREVFAEAAREKGMELAASPRAARGVSERKPKLAVVHLRRRQGVALADREMVRESLQELEGGRVPPRPWEKAMQLRHAAEKAAYAACARELREAANDREERVRNSLLEEASMLASFGQSLPAPKSRRQRWIEKLRSKEIVRPAPSRPAPERDKGFEREH